MIDQSVTPVMTLGDFRELTRHLPDDKRMEVWVAGRNADINPEDGDLRGMDLYDCTLIGTVHPLRIQASEG